MHLALVLVFCTWIPDMSNGCLFVGLHLSLGPSIVPAFCLLEQNHEISQARNFWRSPCPPNGSFLSCSWDLARLPFSLSPPPPLPLFSTCVERMKASIRFIASGSVHVALKKHTCFHFKLSRFIRALSCPLNSTEEIWKPSQMRDFGGYIEFFPP